MAQHSPVVRTGGVGAAMHAADLTNVALPHSFFVPSVPLVFQWPSLSFCSFCWATHMNVGLTAMTKACVTLIRTRL